MNKTNFAYLAIIPIIAGIFFMSCKSHGGDAEEIADTTATDSVVADTVEAIPVDTTDTIYYRCDTLPSFDGGMQAFINATLNGLQFPEISARYQCEGTYFVDLIIEKNGKVYNANLVKKEKVKIVVPDSVNKAEAQLQVDEANISAIRSIVKNGPACQPAIVNGQPVRFGLRIPIRMTPQPDPNKPQTK